MFCFRLFCIAECLFNSLKRLLLTTVLVCPLNSLAQNLPQWEMGLAFSGIHWPEYRGSASSRQYFIPLPIIRVRGERFKINEQGAEQWLNSTQRTRTTVNVSVGLPVPSESEGLRDGMAALDSVFELGPSFEWLLWQRHKKHQSLTLNFPLRAAISMGRQGVNYRGWISAPFLFYKAQSRGKNRWKFNIAFGPQYADTSYHDYYYGVDVQYVTAKRVLYQAKQGYSGTRVTAYWEKIWRGRWWLGSFVRHDWLQRAGFLESPVVNKSSFTSFGVVFGWVFAKSKHLVEID